MAQLLNTVKGFDNTELLTFLNKNGYGEFEEILKEKGVNGEQFLEITEFELVKWKHDGKKRLWTCITDLKQNPGKFLEHKTIQKRQTTPKSFKKTHIIEQLELVITNKPLGNATSPRSFPMSPESKPKSENLTMQKTHPHQLEAYYDESGYLLPNTNTRAEENEYEAPPTTPKTLKYLKCNSETSASSRKPMTLPRGDQDSISEPNRSYTSEQESPLPIPPKLSQDPKGRTVPATVVTQPSVLPKDNDEQQVVYEPIDYGCEDAQVAQVIIPEKQNSPDNRSRSAALGSFKKGNSPRLMSPSPNLPTSFKDRPLPALPERMVDMRISSANRADYRIQKHDHEDGNRSQSPELLYENENLNSTIPGAQHNLTLPQLTAKYPENYEHFLLKQRNKRLPVPPNTLPQEPLFLNAPYEAIEPQRGVEMNLNDEPFYRNTDRRGSRLLLYDLDDGAFLLRPSKKFFLTLSLKYKGKDFHLGIEKTESNKIRLNTEGENLSPEFSTLTELVNYFQTEYLTFQCEGYIVELYLRTILPSDRF